jgi:hypothetical protein
MLLSDGPDTCTTNQTKLRGYISMLKVCFDGRYLLSAHPPSWQVTCSFRRCVVCEWLVGCSNLVRTSSKGVLFSRLHMNLWPLGANIVAVSRIYPGDRLATIDPTTSTFSLASKCQKALQRNHTLNQARNQSL